MGASKAAARARRALAAAMIAAASLAHGQVFESVVMPGKVIEGHAKLEMQCESCHKRFEKSAQSRLCQDCHKDVATDVGSKRGYHGRAPEAQGKECRACHTEHKGREAKIAPFEQAKFDHGRTDFPLLGAHGGAGVECKSCHEAGKRWREAPGACVECHRKDDTHKGQLGSGCADCHSERTWKEPRFDHGKTRFPLVGKHTGAKCTACHEKAYKEAPRDCLSCHRKNDAHKGRYGPRCETCHDERSWESHFAHDAKTRFALGGKHRTAKCDSCHKGTLYKEQLPLTCVGCHRKDDAHKGSQGDACEKCHGDRSWKTSSFDHDRETKFALRGKHRPAKCDSCHKAGPKQKLATTCVSCHRKDDAHKSTMGAKCETCHGERDWKEARFDHDRDTRYALKGKHRGAKCDACHQQDAYVKPAPSECVSCHRKDDAHKGQQGERCAECHSERDWKGAPFDHSRSRFPLLGAHIKAGCASCHRSALFKDAPRECAGCHGKDDVHKAALGPKCEGCHNARSWKSWDFDHAKRTKYPLQGAHRRAKCVACHSKPATEKVAAPTACYSCHRGDDRHEGAFGSQCERCHGSDDWRDIRAKVSRVADARHMRDESMNRCCVRLSSVPD